MKCKIQKLCGGCVGLSVKNEDLLEKKKLAVQDVMDKYHLNVNVDKVYMAENTLQYRNKVIVGFAKDKDKKVYSGLYASRSHKVLNSKGCMMHPDILNQIIDKITELIDSMKLELYNERTGTGLIRHVLLRYARTTGEVMVVFVTAKKMFPSRRNLVNALVSEFPQIKTIVQNINGRNTSVVLQDESIVLYGDGMITDILCGLKISFTSSSFYQIHAEQTEVLYGLAKSMLDLKKTDTILDTYCGVGTIGLTMADDVKFVTGVEINKAAVENAIYNARQNKIKNCRFVAMDSTKFMFEAKKVHQNYNIIILDPPREGTTTSFIQNACALHPDKILYISCDPKTQARDLNQFRKENYVTRQIQLVDMFPRTEHIESICVLTYRKPKDKTKYQRNEKNGSFTAKRHSGYSHPSRNRNSKAPKRNSGQNRKFKKR